jgi:hypothetical protein
MTEFKEIVKLLRPLGRETACRVVRAFFDSLSLEEQAAIGIALEAEQRDMTFEAVFDEHFKK